MREGIQKIHDLKMTVLRVILPRFDYKAHIRRNYMCLDYNLYLRL